MSSGYDQRRDESYRAAWELAWERLPVERLGEISHTIGSTFDGRTLTMDVLDSTASIDVISRRVDSDLPEHDRFLSIVILHFLAGDHRSTGPTDWVLFRQLPGGESFHTAFQERVVRKLAVAFSEGPEALVRAGRSLGGHEVDFGSATVVLDFLPRLPVRVTVWQGDDDVPGNATMLFPASAARTLPTEDFAEVGAVVLAALLRAFRVNTGQ
jgi:hypothetical protein